MDAGLEGAGGSGSKVKELLQRFEGRTLPAARPFVGAAGSHCLKRKRGGGQHTTESPSSGAEVASASVCHSEANNQDLCLGRNDLDVFLHRRPVRDPGVTYGMYKLLGMRRDDLLKLLASMDQTVAKKKPTRLELFGAAVTLLFSLHRLTL